MYFDLAISVHVVAFNDMTRLPTFLTGLTSTTFNFVGMTSLTAAYHISQLGLKWVCQTHAMDFFCFLMAASLLRFISASDGE